MVGSPGECGRATATPAPLRPTIAARTIAARTLAARTIAIRTIAARTLAIRTLTARTARDPRDHHRRGGGFGTRTAAPAPEEIRR
ncbi:hypothetical protein [Nonomuraea indica]|uniref:hypothetical protein n=1 Tax=Nonomuraea indica TaxID=1581193 RepID=UPI0015DE7FC5|nr:hypothetical protein [Nonomuraea indica]